MILGHFANIERFPEYNNAYCFVYIESNMSYITADLYQNIIRERGASNLHVEFVDRDPHNRGRAGVRTEDTTKEAMVLDLRRELSNGGIQLARSFVSSNEPVVLDKLQRQLKAFRKVPRSTHNPDAGVISFRYSGKGTGQPDDLAFILMSTAYYSRSQVFTEHYQKMARLNGWMI